MKVTSEAHFPGSPYSPVPRRFTWRKGIGIGLTSAQFVTTGGAFFYLFSTGFSVWTLLACLVAAAFTKANLSMTESRLVSDEEAEATMEVANYVLKGAHRRNPHKH